MKTFIGADHAGFKLKEKLKPYLTKLKYQVIDFGNKKYQENDDYPIYGNRVAKAVAKNKNSFGILICGSGQGVCIVANKVKGIRAALAEDTRDAYLARRDDNCNIICLQGRYTNLDKAKIIVKMFLETKFKALKRYKRRINEIKKLEK
ncbi:RpiB/LacA/LacB family sugar-phosphate isomerase [Candidatus Woesearchaeota archaeon]|nr:RpiB/LacA/LacB family sugar-phosphate isomerase [Candidatus Woesearchaeota archaeon]